MLKFRCRKNNPRLNLTVGMWCLAGNLLNSLMGSGEEDDGVEEVQEDSSPIELD